MPSATKPSPTETPAAGASAWEAVAALIEARDPDAVADAVRGLDADGRRAVARALPGHVRAVRARRERWEGIDDYAPAFRAAGAAALTGASAVAAWLTRREFNSRWAGEHDDTGLLLDLWDDRDDAWRADLARRLTLRLRGPRHVGLDLVLALLAETGAAPPEHDPLVVGWVSSAPPRARDPLLPHLLPRVFEADGVGRALRDSTSWPRTLATLADRGEVDRRALLDGCVRRFLRGGTANDLRFFVRLHTLLMPDEPAARARRIRAHARDYVRLLPAAPGTVADLALGLLRELPGLPSDHVVEALDGVLFRAETGLVKSGLSWLEQTVRRAPGLAGDCAPALARAFAHESYAVRRRAVRIALSLPAGADTSAITDAVPLLPPDLAARAAARFGGAVPAPEPDDDPPPAPLPEPAPRSAPPPPPLPPPVAVPAELPELFTPNQPGVLVAERLMDGFVRLAHHDPEAVRAVLAPVLHEGDHVALELTKEWPWVDGWLAVAGRLLTGSAPVPADWRDRMPEPHAASAPHLLLLHRCAEIVAAVERGALPPLLLATPTEPTGHVAPGVLVDRLEALEAAGAEPGPADLQQALLRLPREPDAAAATRAGRLAFPAGRAVAGWIAAGGLPMPEVAMEPFDGRHQQSAISAQPTGLPLVDAVFTAPSWYTSHGHGWYSQDWRLLLPSHPAVVAAHLVPFLNRYSAGGGTMIGELIEAAPAGGPFDDLVAWFMARRLLTVRRGRPEPMLLSLAARGDLPAAALGHHLADLVRDGDARLTAVSNALESAAEAGAYTAVWHIVAAALPGLCPGTGERPPSGLDRLLALALRTARWSKARGAIPEVAELAARKNPSNTVRAAQALTAHLAST